ncbi:hypothetical protein ACLM5J_13295 [Nocardioides sp. Bht2]|uniref:hypothetical protein n=1 Tax=Nocardioides sp. Bht2 TaxID=3392297 RepID=UPI0039B49E0E
MRSTFLLLLCASTAAVSLVASAGLADEGPRPGLPRHTEPGGSWNSVVQGGASEARRAKQWVRVPMQATSLYTTNRNLAPPEESGHRIWENTNYLYLMAETGARHHYGLSAPFTVRTTAFGTIPVSATLRLAQRRTSEDLPTPLIVQTLDEWYAGRVRPPSWGEVHTRYYDLNATDALFVEVEELTVDGVDLGLRAGCRTSTAAPVALHGEGFEVPDPEIDENNVLASGHFTAGKGGLITGTADIPAFANCRTESDEDVSRLLTAAISGPGNSLTLHVSPPAGCGRLLPDVGAYDPTVHCPSQIPPGITLPPARFTPTP